MLFENIQFIFLFLPLTLALFFAVARHSHRAAAGVLILASLIFCATWQPVFLPLTLASMAGNYLIGQRILAQRLHQPRVAQAWLALGIAGNLALLLWSKLAWSIDAGLAATETQTPAGWPHHILPLFLPLGISVFTFSQIAYLVDARRGLVDDSLAKDSRPLHYAAFVSYFPQLIAGPILCHREMLPQLAQARIYRFSWENMAVGLTVFGMGLVKKVVFADALAPFVDAGFSQGMQVHVDGVARGAPALALVPAWLSAIAFSLQIYFTFSGICDMAMGVSRLFGIHLPISFNSPYRAGSIIDFWKRWHMTLSRFLRDYLYIPLGGNRCGEARRALNLMAIMLLGGLWFGLGWTFVIWGGLHGIYLCINHLWRRHAGTDRDARPSRPARLAAQLVTYLAVTVAWVVFRAADPGTAGTMLTSMAGLHGLGVMDDSLRHLAWLCVPLLLIVWFAPNSHQIMAAYHVGPAVDSADHDEETPAAWWQWQPNWRSSLVFCGAMAVALYPLIFTHRISECLHLGF